MGQKKVMSMSQAIEQFVHDGDMVYIGGFVQHEPYAAVHEIIRQRKKNLTVSMCAGIVIIDMLVGAGCANKVISTYVWNPVPKPAHAFKRAVEKGIPHPVEVEDYSVLSLSLAYLAGALDLPFVASKTPLGSDIFSRRSFLGENKFKVIESPFNGERVCLISPLKHDVGIIQIQRADEEGNGQAWGLFADSKYGINSCKKVILCVEEIVPKEVTMGDPNRTIIPGFKVDAVVEVPWGAHPSYVAGYYDMDWDYFLYYDQVTKTQEGFEKYLNDWVYGVKDWKGYLDKIGEERLQRLKAGKRESAPVNYGLYHPWEVIMK